MGKRKRPTEPAPPDPGPTDVPPDGGTSQTRIFKDLGYMLAWITRLEGGSSAEVLDPLIRGPISGRFERIRPEVERLEALEREVKAAEQQARQALRQRE